MYEQLGEPFTGVGNYKGYNEIVVDSKHWLEGLPGSVEAIFMVDCEDGDANLRYGAADGGGTAESCQAARDRRSCPVTVSAAAPAFSPHERPFLLQSGQ